MAIDENNIVIRVRGLTNTFGEQIVHENLDLDVRRGEIIGVVGGSGAGKSVLMRSIIGLRRPDAGAIEVLGVDARAARTKTSATASNATPACCSRTARCSPRSRSARTCRCR